MLVGFPQLAENEMSRGRLIEVVVTLRLAA